MNEDLIILGIAVIYIGLFVLGTAIYMVPTFIAFRRNHPNRWLIMAINVFVGGTGIGWGVALVWALRIAHLQGDDNGSSGGDSGLNVFGNDVRRMRVEPPMTRAEASPETVPSTDETLRQIERLRHLLDSGHIDLAEFSYLKAAILRQQ